MKLSLTMLGRLVDIDGLASDDIANRLTMSTAETEGVEELNAHFRTIVTAKLLDVQKHPDSDHLTLVKADAGGTVYSVVCGATNHKTGDIVPLALEGTAFSKDFIIKKTKIRGVESTGMLCSARELGLSEDHSGILIFPADTPLGVPLSTIFADSVDSVIEIDNKSITHRPDLWGHMGFAREIAAIFGRKLKRDLAAETTITPKGDEKLSVSIDCPDAAPRYTGLIMKGIRIEESPAWLKASLTAIGMRPINNIVDITNYVMAELGEPMHAFDRKKLPTKEILVRLAKPGETITTLDGNTHELTAEDIVITDGKTPVALAGVMGGGNSEIDDATTEIVLEAANFRAVNIRKTAHRCNLRTDAAMRFEKSLDPELTPAALRRAAELIMEIIPGSYAAGPFFDAYPVKHKPNQVTIAGSTIRAALGADIPDSRIASILESLSFTVKQPKDDFEITVPTYRSTKDVGIPADIIEEIGRIHGYDNIIAVPPLVPCETPHENVKRQLERRIKRQLSAHQGMIEVYNYSFTGEEVLKKALAETGLELHLRNPLSVEQDRMRRTLIPALVTNIEFNARFNKSFAIYELGRVYLKKNRTDPELCDERSMVAGAFYAHDDEVQFYNAKRAVAETLERLGLKSVRIEPAKEAPAYAHPGRTAQVVIDGKTSGHIFDLHPQVAENFGIKGTAALFELDMELILTASRRKKLFTELQRFPDVPFDVSVICDDKTYAADIANVITKAAGKSLQRIDVVSLYRSAPIPDGMKSVSFRVIFGSDEKTLEPAEIESLQKAVMDAVRSKGYQIR